MTRWDHHAKGTRYLALLVDPGETVEIDVSDLNADELEVLGTRIARTLNRLRLGIERYGHLDIDADPRDWRQERGEEIDDCGIYDDIELIRIWRRR